MDENNKGDGLTPEQIQAIIKERDEAKAAADKLKQERDNTVEEIKELRKKRQEAEEALKNNATPPDEVEKKIAEVLRAEKDKSLQKMREDVLNEFIAKHPEFSSENDSAGLRKLAFEKKLSRFNLSVTENPSELNSVLEDALSLLKKETPDNERSPYASDPSSHGAPMSSDGSKLTAKERELINRVGWDQKKYMEMKARRPEYIEQLLNY